MKTAIDKYVGAYSDTDGRRVLTKDKAYIAAGDILGKVAKIRGVKQNKFLEEHFMKIWDDHDPNHNNLIEQGDVEQFYNDILNAGTPEVKPDDDWMITANKLLDLI